MRISKEWEGATNAKMGRESGPSLQYTSIAAYFDADNLPNLAAFFYRQAGEEHMHAMKFLHYLVEAGGKARIPAIPATRHEFTNALECAQLALHWEAEGPRQISPQLDQAI